MNSPPLSPAPRPGWGPHHETRGEAAWTASQPARPCHAGPARGKAGQQVRRGQPGQRVAGGGRAGDRGRRQQLLPGGRGRSHRGSSSGDVAAERAHCAPTPAQGRREGTLPLPSWAWAGPPSATNTPALGWAGPLEEPPVEVGQLWQVLCGGVPSSRCSLQEGGLCGRRAGPGGGQSSPALITALGSRACWGSPPPPSAAALAQPGHDARPSQGQKPVSSSADNHTSLRRGRARKAPDQTAPRVPVTKPLTVLSACPDGSV